MAALVLYVWTEHRVEGAALDTPLLVDMLYISLECMSTHEDPSQP